MACTPFSFLILSDIHFGAYAEHHDFALAGAELDGHVDYTISMRANLVETTKAAGIKIDAILVPGDLTSRACPNEFEGCWAIIEEFADALEVGRESIFVTYGNHDSNWRISELAAGNGKFGPDESFRHIASCVGTFFCRDPQPQLRGPLPGSGVFRSPSLELIILNSGYFCTNDQVLKHGKLGFDQLEWLQGLLAEPANTDRWRVVMLHHHSYNYPYPAPVYDLSFVEEGDVLVDLFGGNQVDFVCHGHRHHPILRTRMDNTWTSPVTFLCAGSVAVNANHRANGHIPNLFHLVTLERRHPASNGALGTVRNYRFSIPQGWMLNDYSPTVPVAGIHHFGSVAAQRERRDIAVHLVEDALAASHDPFVHLPAWEGLPPDLRYTTLDETNAALEVAVADINGQLFRKYPEIPVIVRPV